MATSQIDGNQAYKDLGISKKGRFGLNVKPGATYTKTRDKLAGDDRDETLFYDPTVDLFTLFFQKGNQDNYAEIKFRVENNKIVGMHLDVYISSTATSHQVMDKIKAMLNKSYDSKGRTEWGDSKMTVEFFDGSSNGFSGFVLDYEQIQ